MENIDKKIKAGLKKCPLHKFGSEYKSVKDGWYQCKKCKAYHKVDDEILKEAKGEVKIWSFKYGIRYEFI